jgi:NAD(P)-dependent dehydrogenase (short-subunit alcohol dehydrogenase family)
MGERLKNKVAVITGTGDGMARTVALRFASEGAAVVGCDINEQTAAETLRLVRDAGGTMEALFPLDLADEAQTHRLMQYAVDAFGGIDILYNNAMAMRMATPLDMPREDFDFTLTNTLTIGWLATKHAVPHMKERGGASIIFVGSVSGATFGSGFAGNGPQIFAYSVAKGGVIRMAIALASELGRYGIRVNCISPGPIMTAPAVPIYGDEGSALRHAMVQHNLVGRIGVPDDIANAALFLASDESSYIAGHNLQVDGGYAASGGQGLPDETDEAIINAAVGGFMSVDSAWTAVPSDAGGTL